MKKTEIRNRVIRESKWKFSVAVKKLVKDPIKLDILTIAWPVLMELVLSSVFGMIDMMMLGNIPNNTYAAAAVSSVGLTNQPLFLALSVVQALNVGGTAMIARYYGAGEKKRMENVLKHVMLFGLFFSIPISAFGLLNAENIMSFMGGEAHAIEIGASYFRVICISYLFQSFNISITGALRGIGQTQIPMRINVLVNFLNVLGNAVLIYGLLGAPALGVVGAATSTATANLIASVLLVRFLMKGNSELPFSFKRKFKFDTGTLKNLVRIGMPSAIEQLILRAGVILFIQIVSSLGTVIFAAHQIGMNLLSLSFTTGQAFGISSSSLVGRSLGKKDTQLASEYAKKTSMMGAITGILVGTVLFIGSEFFVSLYSNDPQIIHNASTALKIIAVVQPFQTHQLIVAGSLRGAGDTMFPLISTFVGVLIVRVISAYFFVFVLNLGLVGAWMGIVLDQFLRWILVGARFKAGKWKSIVIH
ncbi:MAG: MATE family efflux transporter [Desemzia incerta]